jgi:hypothetical protein
MTPVQRVLPFAAMLLLAAGAATACGLPYPGNSSVDSILVACPAGDIAFHVTPRDLAYQGAPGLLVWLDFCSTSGWAIDPGPVPASQPYLDRPPCTPTTLTDSRGMATFALRAGGSTGGGTVVVYGDGGIRLRARVLASPDQNGDLLVNATDVALLAAKLGTNDPSADFDGDGVVTAADQAIQRAHLGHAAEQPVPVATSTWGRLKALGR